MKKMTHWTMDIITGDRAAMATLSGEIAKKVSAKRMQEIEDKGEATSEHSFNANLSINFKGSAGQGFGVFMTEGLTVRLEGEANDSVAKGMSGGSMVINPSSESTYDPSDNAIIGNCALYGATGGKAFCTWPCR